MLSITSQGYNIGVVSSSVKLVVGASTVVDNDASKIDRLVSFAKTGVLRIKTKIDMSGVDIDFDGAVVANICANGIEFHTITYYADQVTGGDPIIIGGQAYVEDGKIKVHLTAEVVS